MLNYEDKNALLYLIVLVVSLLGAMLSMLDPPCIVCAAVYVEPTLYCLRCCNLPLIHLLPRDALLSVVYAVVVCLCVCVCVCLSVCHTSVLYQIG